MPIEILDENHRRRIVTHYGFDPDQFTVDTQTSQIVPLLRTPKPEPNVTPPSSQAQVPTSEKPNDFSAAKTFGLHVLRAAPPGLAALPAGIAAHNLAAPLYAGGATAWIPPVAGIVAGAGTAIGLDKFIVDPLVKRFLPSYQKQLELSQQEDPNTAFAGQLGGSLITGRPNLRNVGAAAQTVGKLGGKLLQANTPAIARAELANLADVGIGGAIPAAQEGYNAATNSEEFSPGKAAINVGAGLLFNRLNSLGRLIGRVPKDSLVNDSFDSRSEQTKLGNKQGIANRVGKTLGEEAADFRKVEKAAYNKELPERAEKFDLAENDAGPRIYFTDKDEKGGYIRNQSDLLTNLEKHYPEFTTKVKGKTRIKIKDTSEDAIREFLDKKMYGEDYERYVSAKKELADIEAKLNFEKDHARVGRDLDLKRFEYRNEDKIKSVNQQKESLGSVKELNYQEFKKLWKVGKFSEGAAFKEPGFIERLQAENLAEKTGGEPPKPFPPQPFVNTAKTPIPAPPYEGFKSAESQRGLTRFSEESALPKGVSPRAEPFLKKFKNDPRVKLTRSLYNYFKEKGATLRNVKLSEDGYINKDGQPVSGVAILRDGLKEGIAKINPNLAGADTPAHELLHHFIEDLKNSPKSADRRLYEDFKRAVEESDALKKTNELRVKEGKSNVDADEVMTEGSSYKVLEQVLNLDGKNGKLSRTWENFLSALKTRWIKNSSLDDYERVITNRFLNDPSFQERYGSPDYKPGPAKDLKERSQDDSQLNQNKDPYAKLKTTLIDPSTNETIIGNKGEDHYTIYNKLSDEGKKVMGLDKPTETTRQANYKYRGWTTENGDFISLGDLKAAGGDIELAVKNKEKDKNYGIPNRQAKENEDSALSNKEESDSSSKQSGAAERKQSDGGGIISEKALAPEGEISLGQSQKESNINKGGTIKEAEVKEVSPPNLDKLLEDFKSGKINVEEFKKSYKKLDEVLESGVRLPTKTKERFSEESELDSPDDLFIGPNPEIDPKLMPQYKRLNNHPNPFKIMRDSSRIDTVHHEGPDILRKETAIAERNAKIEDDPTRYYWLRTVHFYGDPDKYQLVSGEKILPKVATDQSDYVKLSDYKEGRNDENEHVSKELQKFTPTALNRQLQDDLGDFIENHPQYKEVGRTSEDEVFYKDQSRPQTNFSITLQKLKDMLHDYSKPEYRQHMSEDEKDFIKYFLKQYPEHKNYQALKETSPRDRKLGSILQDINALKLNDDEGFLNVEMPETIDQTFIEENWHKLRNPVYKKDPALGNYIDNVLDYEGPSITRKGQRYSESSQLQGSNPEDIRANFKERDENPLFKKENPIVRNYKELPHKAPLFASDLDKLSRRAGESGKYAAPKLKEVFNQTDEYLGKTLNPTNEILSRLNRKEQEELNIIGLAGKRDDKDYTDSLSSEKLKEAMRDLRKLFVFKQTDQAKSNQPVDEFIPNGKGGFKLEKRLPKVNPNWWPEVASGKNLDILLNFPGSQAFDKLKSDFVGVIKNKYKLDDKEANGLFEDMLASYGGPIPGNQTRFGAVRKAEGIGLPDSWLEQDPVVALDRYWKRVAKDRAYYNVVENDPKMMHILGYKKHNVPDPENPGKFLLKNVPDISGEGYNKIPANEYVRRTLDILQGQDIRTSPILDAAARIANNLILGPITGLNDAFAAPFLMAKFAPTYGDAFKSLTSIMHLRDSIQSATDTGRIKNKLSDYDDVFTPKTDLVTTLRKVSDNIAKVTGRTTLEKFSRGISQGMAEYFIPIHKKLAESGNKSSLKLLEGLANSKDYNSLDVKTLASRLIDLTQGTYDPRGLPSWAIDSQIAPIIRLARWNIEQANSFYKHVLVPAGSGNIKPLIITLFGAGAGGLILKELREKATNKKLAMPSLDELAKSSRGLEGNIPAVAYNYMAGLSYIGALGSFGEIAKTGFDYAFKNKPQGYNYPLLEILGDGVTNIARASNALMEGEDPLKVAKLFAEETLSQQIQMGRLSYNWFAGDSKEEAKGRRDLRAYKMAEGLPYAPQGSGEGFNPFEGMNAREFKKSPSLPDSARLAKGLVAEAFQTNKGNPLQLKKELSGLKRNNLQTFPSPSESPEEFIKYQRYLTNLLGKKEAMERVKKYLKQRELNKAKSALIPSL